GTARRAGVEVLFDPLGLGRTDLSVHVGRKLFGARVTIHESSLQESPELIPAARDPRANGADPDPQNFGDFFVGQAFDVTQHHSLPEGLRQQGEPGGDPAAFVGGHRQLLRSTARVRVGHLALLDVLPDGLGQRTPAGETVPAVVDRNAEDPGLEGRAPTEAPEVPVDAQEDLLRQIRRLFAVSRETKCQVVDHLCEPCIDLVERLRVSTTVSFYELELDIEVMNDSGSRSYPHRDPPRVQRLHLSSTDGCWPGKVPASDLFRRFGDLQARARGVLPIVGEETFDDRLGDFLAVRAGLQQLPILLVVQVADFKQHLGWYGIIAENGRHPHALVADDLVAHRAERVDGEVETGDGGDDLLRELAGESLALHPLFLREGHPRALLHLFAQGVERAGLAVAVPHHAGGRDV